MGQVLVKGSHVMMGVMTKWVASVILMIVCVCVWHEKRDYIGESLVS